MFHHSLTRFALAFLAITFCQAQDEQKISLQFLAFPAQATPEPIELLIGENKTITVDTPSNELSPEYKITRPEWIALGNTIKNDKGNPAFQVLAKAQPLASPKQIIILIRKGESNRDGFNMIPIDGALNNFSGGSYLLVNISQLGIGGLIGDKKFSLKPGQRDLLKPKATHEGGGCQVTLAYQKNETDTKGKTFYDTRWTVNDAIRTLVFFYQDPETKKIGIAPIVNFL
jgi:hypothetical protein